MSKKVKLLKDHTHKGKPYAPGAELTLRDSQADRLIELGVATRATGSVTIKPDKAEG